MSDMIETKQNVSKKGLNGTQIKFIGIIMMVFDHIHQMFYGQVPDWFAVIGRPVAPIFIFMCAEGFHYTRNKKRYMLTLLVGSLFMSIATMIISQAFPSDVVLINNIFSTLFLCTVYMLGIDYIKKGHAEKKVKYYWIGIGIFIAPVLIAFGVMQMLALPIPIFVLRLILMIPNLITTEGGFLLVVLGALFYLFREKRWVQVLVLVLMSVLVYVLGDHLQALMVLAVIFMLLYNGQRGRGDKYFFYVFYPAHIYFLYILSYYINR